MSSRSKKNQCAPPSAESLNQLERESDIDYDRDRRRKRLFALAGDLTLESKIAKAIIYHRYKIESAKDMTNDQMEDMIGALEMMERNEAELRFDPKDGHPFIENKPLKPEGNSPKAHPRRPQANEKKPEPVACSKGRSKEPAAEREKKMSEQENKISPKEAHEILEGFDTEFQDTEVAKDFSPVPADIDVGLEVTEQSWIRSGSGTAGLQLTMEIMEPVKHEGSRIWHTFWITSKNLKYVKRDVSKFGVTIESLGDLADIDFKNRTVGGRTKHETYTPEGGSTKTSTRMAYLREWGPNVGEGDGTSDTSTEKTEAKKESAPAASAEKDSF